MNDRIAAFYSEGYAASIVKLPHNEEVGITLIYRDNSNFFVRPAGVRKTWSRTRRDHAAN